ncbi:hypothetical protein SLS63_013807 [Diaporthe eres]|uniref:Uncharacterized protein n=1 Tax=Diaporthe eres TaxID=83184 RepID=A0ABR1NMF5_DIAER
MLSIIFILLFALLGATSPTDGTNPPPSSLSWTGEVAGHGVVTLYGDAGSVQEQIFALNPTLAEKYVPTTQFMSKTPPAYNTSEVFAGPGSAYYYKSTPHDANDMAARDDVNGAKKLSEGFNPTDWYCGTFATGDSSEVYYVVSSVASPGGQDPAKAMWTIAGRIDGKSNCQRLGCAVIPGDPGSTARYGSTAVYWCNDNDFKVTTAAANLAAVAASIANGHQAFNFAGCCKKSQDIGSHKQFSGQMHLGNGTNINVGYGDCSKSDYFVNPSDLGYPGPLGSCI